jgi:integrase
LFRRKSRLYYFRFRLPIEMQSVLGREEIRLSLETVDVKQARECVVAALPHVYAIKRLSRTMNELTQDELRRAVSFAVTRLVDALERSREPWMRNGSGNGTAVDALASLRGFASLPVLNGDRLHALEADNLRHAITAGEHTGGVELAKQVLSTLNVKAAEDTPLFRQLALEMLKLRATLLRVEHARQKGDYQTELDFIAHYRANGHAPATGAAVPTGPTITEAWKDYAAEKTGARPTPVWSAKTALGQEAMFAEFRDIVGDIRTGLVTRDVMLRYRDGVARLPANRRKRYPDKSIAELLEMEIPDDQLPSARTVQEKLVQIGAFLKWCRETKQYLTGDPMTGVHVDAESQSYAPFTPTDLRKLFNSTEYQRGEHLKSWHFWIPLVALYTGARQAEIGQLETRNVVQEDGVWIFVITDAGEDQRVKTKAGVRKVPISSKLIALGFLDYVAFIKQRGDTRLFPDLPRGKHGWGDKVSRWFNYTYKKNCGVEADPTGRRKVFHSFRHTAITKALSKGQALLVHAQQVFGHEKSLLGETGTYTAPFPVDMLVPVVESLDFALDHSAYADAWRKYVTR